MFGKKRPDVLVSGAGPVGLFTALVLSKRGVPVEIVDKERRTGTHSYALALHASSLRLLDEFGVLSDVLEKAYRIRSVGLYDEKARRAELSIADLPEDYSFVAVMRQADLERALEEALKAAGVKVMWNHEVDSVHTQHGDPVRVTLNKLSQESLGYVVQHAEWVVSKRKDIEVRFVIGADGIRSTVRRNLEIGFPEVGEATDFAVFEFKTDADFGDEMSLVLADDATSVCWPLPGGYCRWSFDIPRDEKLESREKDRLYGQLGTAKFPMLDEQHLHDFLAARAPWFKGSIEDIRWRMEVRFERRLADSFGKGHVWLVGDAGHLTGPAGIQSMNVGLREARELGMAVADVMQGKASSAALEEYDHGRRVEWGHLLGLEAGLVGGSATDPWIAARGPRLLSSIPASGDDLMRLAAQVGLIAG